MQKLVSWFSEQVFGFYYHICSFSSSCFPTFLLNTTICSGNLYSVRKRENMDQKNFDCGQLSRSVFDMKIDLNPENLQVIATLFCDTKHYFYYASSISTIISASRPICISLLLERNGIVTVRLLENCEMRCFARFRTVCTI